MNHPQKKLTLWMLAFGLMLTVAISPPLAKAQMAADKSAASDTMAATTKKSEKTAAADASASKTAAAYRC
jgi:hypothetical protein